MARVQSMGAQHIIEADVALYAAHDLPWWRQQLLQMHLARCAACNSRIAAYRSDQNLIRQMAAEMPTGLTWDRLAAEMTANIRVGLEAGECVARPRERTILPPAWRVTAAVAAVTVLLISAWWLNMPASQSASLEGAMKKISQVRPWRSGGMLPLENRGPLVEVSASGIQLRENGGALGVSQGLSRPIAVTLSVQGSARARYLDLDTGQVTITSVYAQ